MYYIQTLPFFMAGLYGAAFDQDIEWLVVKGIADFADQSTSWQSFASAMAASVVFHFLSDANIFSDWPHYKGEFYYIRNFSLGRETSFTSRCGKSF